MALLLLGARAAAVRVDLATLPAADAVADVPAGPHHLSVLSEAGSWYHGWVFVDPGAEVVAIGGDGADPSAVVALPADDGTWAVLTAHLDEAARLAGGVPLDERPGATRFERAAAGDLLAELERSFVEWVLPSGGADPAAGRRWRELVVALAAAGPPGVEAHGALVAEAVDVVVVQLGLLPADAVAASVREALGDLADDLAEPAPESAALLRSAVAG